MQHQAGPWHQLLSPSILDSIPENGAESFGLCGTTRSANLIRIWSLHKWKSGKKGFCTYRILSKGAPYQGSTVNLPPYYCWVFVCVCVFLFVSVGREIIAISFVISYRPLLVSRLSVKKNQLIKYICTKCSIYLHQYERDWLPVSRNLQTFITDCTEKWPC